MSDPVVDRPIFLLGTGRCGSSLLHRLLGYHPDVAWISHWTAYMPGDGWWAAASRVHDLPGLERLLPKAEDLSKAIPQPAENYAPLQKATDHVFTAPRRLTEADVTPEATRRLRALAARHVRAQGKDRFLLKYTGFPRVRYLKTIFPDARFVHVIRDGRAVASSLCRVSWWSGEGTWSWGPMAEEDRKAWRDSGCHELVLAAIYWKVLMQHLESARADAPPGQYLELRYDQLVGDRQAQLDHVLDFLDLRRSPKFERRVAATEMTSDDRRWRQHLDAEEQRLLEGVLREPLVKYGFEAA